jgi:hypothetical protein
LSYRYNVAETEPGEGGQLYRDKTTQQAKVFYPLLIRHVSAGIPYQSIICIFEVAIREVKIQPIVVGAMYRRIARKRGKQKAIVAVSRVICEIAWILICDPSARYRELGPHYCQPLSPARQTRAKIREIERLNPARKSSSPTPAAQPDHRTHSKHATTATGRSVTPPDVIPPSHREPSPSRCRGSLVAALQRG